MYIHTQINEKQKLPSLGLSTEPETCSILRLVTLLVFFFPSAFVSIINQPVQKEYKLTLIYTCIMVGETDQSDCAKVDYNLIK